MSEPAGIAEELARMLLAHERLAATRRQALGLGGNEEVVLLFLAHGINTPTELSRAVGMTTAGMTNLLDRLEQGGYIRREPHRTDKRRVLITLTKRGFRAHLRFDTVNAQIDTQVRSLPQAEQDVVRRFLADATSAMEGEASGEPPDS